MNPLLAITAARIGTNVIRSLAENVGSSPSREPQGAKQADRAQFAAALSRVASSPEVRALRFLEAEGIHDRADAETRVGDLARRIAQSPALREFAGESAGDIDMRIHPDGRVEVRAGDSRERSFILQGEDAELARTAARILEIAEARWPSSTFSTRSMQKWSERGVVHLTPGGGVSVR